MANPFLFGEEEMEDAGAEATVNPFLLGDTEGGDDGGGESDNPFGGPNPFAFGGDDGEDVPTTMAEILQGEDTTTTTQASSRSNDPVMNFFSTTIDEADEPHAEESKNDVEEELNKEQRGSIPLSKTTQDLIETVAGHLEQTSTELLERLPATRSPSPISMRDIASPSPTPDSAFGDLMDYSDSASMQGVDNPFGAPTSVPQVQAVAPVPPPMRAQPPRPPPPRPVPPRPTPPVPPAPVQPTPQEQPDLFDVHDTPAAPSRPPAPKSKDDILSLYDPKPNTTQQPDLLTDDIDLKETETEIEPETKQSPPKEQPIFAVEEKLMEELTVKENKQAMRRAPTPDIEVTTCPDNPRSDDEEEEQQQEPEVKPPQTDSASPPTESSQPVTTDITPHTSEPEQMDTGLDFAPPSGVSSANPFASPEDDEEAFPPASAVTNIFGVEEAADQPIATNIFAAEPATNIFAAEPATNIFAAEPEPAPVVNNVFGDGPDEFDAFAAKFESAKSETGLVDGFRSITPLPDAWGDDAFGGGSVTDSGLDDGFGSADGDDPFLSMKAPPRTDSAESIDKGFSVSIRSKEGIKAQGPAPHIAPPPPQRTMVSDRVNPFDKEEEVAEPFPTQEETTPAPGLERTDSQDTPQTPLFDEDVSQPLEDFPRLHYEGNGWEMQLRQPNKKKITGQRFWKKIFVRMVYQGDNPVVQLYNQVTDKQPFQELPLQPSYSVSDIGAQQFDQFGKIFTMKLQYIFYKERPGVRPGQITKAERITTKLSQFAQYAIAGDYAGVKEFGSDLKKLGLPVEHAPQSSQLAKLGSMNYEDMKQFSVLVEEALFKLNSHRDRALTYKMEEVQVTAVDEFYVEQDFDGVVKKQIARVRLFFLAFLSGMPGIELGLNDMWRQGREVVGRHDIIPVVTEEWIRLEAVEFHNTVNLEEYERTRTIKFQPPDAQYIELMRFRVRPPKNRELPLQLKATWCVTGNKVELRADVLVPGFASRKLGQIPCEDVSIRFPIPECWIYLFRVEKHFRYGSVKSAHRRTGKIKGIERILGAVDTLQESLIEVTSGQAKYEHHHRAIVWRCPRLPKEGQGAYTTHQLVCRMALTSYDQIPAELAPYAFVEFTMPATTVSHTTVRSVSVQDSDSDEPPEKYVRYLARHEYRVGIETTHGSTVSAYASAAKAVPQETTAAKPTAAAPMPPSDSDSDSN